MLYSWPGLNILRHRHSAPCRRGFHRVVPPRSHPTQLISSMTGQREDKLSEDFDLNKIWKVGPKPSYKKTRQWQGRMYRSMSITVFRNGGNTLAIEVYGCSNNQKQPRTVAIRHKMHALAISLGGMHRTAHVATTFQMGMSQNVVAWFPLEKS